MTRKQLSRQLNIFNETVIFSHDTEFMKRIDI